MRKETLRIIDANFNRSREGLRVCEDVARFALNSASLSRALKGARHSVTRAIKESGMERSTLFGARDSRRDVGRASQHKSEMAREDFADIFAANIERVKESLRVLEEVFKLIDKKVSHRFSRIRFQVYDIEKRSVKGLR